MKKTTVTVLTTVLMMTALCALPLAGQEKVAVKMESAVREGVQLRADGALPGSIITNAVSGIQPRAASSAWPDSVVVYSETGQREETYIYTYDSNGEVSSTDRHRWTDNQRFYYPYKVYDMVYGYAVLRSSSGKVEYEADDHSAFLYFPIGWRDRSFFAWISLDDTRLQVKAEYDSKGNLTFFDGNTGSTQSIIEIEYDASDRIVSLEKFNGKGRLIFSITYTYSDKGQLIYVEGKEPLSNVVGGGIGDGPLVDHIKEINRYDMEGRLVSTQHYWSDYYTGKWLSDEERCYQAEYRYDNNGNLASICWYGWSTSAERWSLIRQSIYYPNCLSLKKVDS
jgi:hypothetical protein